ncbi:MAG: tRNA (N(6)-L-threonylcarbamoyladenosine(37)-C(2))-methylthiotransferase MtaB [Spirochaetaceae bacterium]|nr:tRNA (N(6)-L-threonylcarbamoyladenosine(37)-C(2))-methylthiotransferase MtaB [Spirochaetaceae bacterium]
MPSVFFYTLGCKLNQYESETLASSFVKHGFSVFFNEPFNNIKGSLAVINTCSVTSKAGQKARRIIHAAEKTAAAVIVTGCYAELEAENLSEAAKKNGSKVVVVPGSLKNSLQKIPLYIKHCYNAGAASVDEGVLYGAVKAALAVPGFFKTGVFENEEGLEKFFFRSRPFIKIQDGCDNECSYCCITLARGKSQSANPKETSALLRFYEDSGMAEAVLTGVNAGLYSFTEDGETVDLAALLALLLKQTDKIAVRLPSLDPSALTENFYQVLKNERVRPHFHLSAQSGSASVLKDMGRNYTPQAVFDAARKLRAVKNDPFIACDVITGFPGETEEDFNDTLDLCREAGFTWIHAFPYSPRPGTKAFSFKRDVTEKEAARRARILTLAAFESLRSYIKRWTGKPLPAVVTETEGACGPAKEKDFFTVLTENYIKVKILSKDFTQPQGGSALVCVITDMDGECGSAKGRLA